MAKNIGIVGIIVEDRAASPALHAVLHKYSDIIVGRQGIPFHDRDLSVISIVVEGEAEQIAQMTDEIGRIDKISSKAVIRGEKV